MSAELAIATPDSTVSLAEAMGVSQPKSSSKTSTLARITQVHQPIKGEIELAGKKISTEVVTQGMYKIEQGDQVSYATELSIQVYAQREQWTRWDTEKDMMGKTVMDQALNKDLKDNMGGFNLGRGNKYYTKKEWDELPQSTKTKITSVKRTKIVLGLVSAVGGLIDENGQPSDMEVHALPFVMDVKNRQSLGSLTSCIKSIMSKNLLPIEYSIGMTHEIHSMPTGATYSSTIYKPLEKVEIDEKASSTVLGDFLDWIKNANNYILDAWQEAQDTSLSSEDAEIVSNLVDVSADEMADFA